MTGGVGREKRREAMTFLRIMMKCDSLDAANFVPSTAQLVAPSINKKRKRHMPTPNKLLTTCSPTSFSYDYHITQLLLFYIFII